MLTITRFKFDNEKSAIEVMATLFGVDDSGEVIIHSEDHSVTMIGSPTIHTYDEKGDVVNSIAADGYHVNVVTRIPLDVTDNVITPDTPWCKIQGE